MATLKQVREIRRINLKALIENQYKNQAHFIRETGINQGLISALLRGEKTFGEVAARNIEDRAGIPPGWLDNESQTEMPEKPTFVPVPILDVKASCGNGYANGDNVEISGTWNMPLDYLKALGVSPANAEIIIATSYSMFPTIRNGAHVLINKADRSPREGSIYAINLNGEMVIKRLFRTGIHWILRSDNPDKNENPDRDLPETESTAIYGRVVWFDTSL